jgi:hypothetical protein
MALNALTVEGEIRDAFVTYTKNINRGTEAQTRSVGFPGGHEECSTRPTPQCEKQCASAGAPGLEVARQWPTRMTKPGTRPKPWYNRDHYFQEAQA